jgi:phospholipid/cholesterol/gamma-HCH transport system substrate-binding protein
MPQRKELTWSELRVGVFVLVGILVVMVGIFYVTGTGFLGAKYRLVTYLPEVDGLATGAKVTLDGVEVGNVDAIQIAKPKAGQPSDTKRSVEVVLRVSRDFQNDIRSDSAATLLTQGFLGDRLVTVQRGYTGKVLQDGEEIPGAEEKSLNEIMANGAELMMNLNELSKQAASLVSDVQSGRGTLGALLTDKSAYEHANKTLERVDQMTAALQEGQGTIGKLLTDDTIYTKVNSVTGRLDDVMAAVQDQKGTIGKLIYDPSIHDQAKQFMANGNGLVSDVRGGRGTLGKLATDDTFFASWKQVGDNLSQATAKLNDNKGTAGEFFTDPKFYDNLTALTGNMKLLIDDFRRDPKKFLHVKFSIF